MIEDIRLSVSFIDDRKTVKLRKKLGDIGLYYLLKLWSNAAKKRSDGTLVGWDAEDVAIEAGFTEGDHEKFVSTLVEIGFLEVDSDKNYVIHDWLEHQGWVAGSKKRSDKGRLYRLKRKNKEAFEKLKSQGVSGISRQEYQKYVNDRQSKPEGDLQGDLQGEVEGDLEGATREPSTPVPVPIPVPTPKVIINNKADSHPPENPPEKTKPKRKSRAKKKANESIAEQESNRAAYHRSKKDPHFQAYFGIFSALGKTENRGVGETYLLWEKAIEENDPELIIFAVKKYFQKVRGSNTSPDYWKTAHGFLVKNCYEPWESAFEAYKQKSGYQAYLAKAEGGES